MVHKLNKAEIAEHNRLKAIEFEEKKLSFGAKMIDTKRRFLERKSVLAENADQKKHVAAQRQLELAAEYEALKRASAEQLAAARLKLANRQAEIDSKRLSSIEEFKLRHNAKEVAIEQKKLKKQLELERHNALRQKRYKEVHKMRQKVRDNFNERQSNRR